MEDDVGLDCHNGAKRLYTSTLTFVFVTLLVFISTCSSIRYADYAKSPSYRQDALKTLQTVKKRLAYSHGKFLTKRWHKKSCRGLYDRCVAWNGRPDQLCCDVASHVCTCNIFLKNCRCEPRTFNWRSWW